MCTRLQAWIHALAQIYNYMETYRLHLRMQFFTPPIVLLLLYIEKKCIFEDVAWKNTIIIQLQGNYYI